jgi:hypothetical protein
MQLRLFVPHLFREMTQQQHRYDNGTTISALEERACVRVFVGGAVQCCAMLIMQFEGTRNTQ